MNIQVKYKIFKNKLFNQSSDPLLASKKSWWTLAQKSKIWIFEYYLLNYSITMLLDNKKRYKESGSLWLDFYLLPKTNVLFEKKGLVMWSEFFKHKNWYLRVLWVLTYNHIHTPSLGFCVMIFFCHLLVRSTGCIGTVLWF